LGNSVTYSISGHRIVFGKTPHTTQDQWLLEATDLAKNEDRRFVMTNIHRMIDDDKVQKFFCVTVYVMDDEQRFLMLHNRKLDKWVPPGGKVDRDETPDQSAVRECFEETGINIDLVGEKTPVEGGLINPYGIQLNPIIPGLRDHVDLIYFIMQFYLFQTQKDRWWIFTRLITWNYFYFSRNNTRFINNCSFVCK